MNDELTAKFVFQFRLQPLIGIHPSSFSWYDLQQSLKLYLNTETAYIITELCNEDIYLQLILATFSLDFIRRGNLLNPIIVP